MSIRFISKIENNNQPQRGHFSQESLSLPVMRSHLQAVFNNKELGFHQLPDRANLWEDTARVSNDLRRRFDNLIVIGIGGSALGGVVINEALGYKSNSHKVCVLDDVDPLKIENFLLNRDLKKTAFALISKSGTTIETLSVADYFFETFQKAGLNFFDHCVVVTELKSSPLFDFAKKHKIPFLEVPLDVGGRFSVLSPVGMLVASFLGLNTDHFRAGADAARKDIDSICNFSTEILKSWNREESITILWSYSTQLNSFGYWIQQIWAESLAKKLSRNNEIPRRASTPLACQGPRDQHSILQQFVEGSKDKYILFFRNKETERAGTLLKGELFGQTTKIQNRSLGELLRIEAEGTQMGLVQSGISTGTVEFDQINETSLGFAFMWFELVVATLGEALNINAFNQPGVEVTKSYMKKILN
jgi:glucose-6-phosphate isomerase